ncbi:ABC transporter ATP-binding protein [Sorangium sp. So ce260]|uniref:ABC transporter ATP-binding protein n=1 Tax=Sorangium sp. So ce260 TaxID=3133291 RepID=UPI003F60F4CC
MAPSPLLSVQDLRVEFMTPTGPVCAVDNVSFDIAPGEVLGLAGESGSGKSTVAMAIMRLLRPPAIITGGHVYFAGQDVLSMNEDQLRAFRWRKMALVFQSAMTALNPVLTIGEQIADPIIAHDGVTKAQAMERAASLLKLVNIDSSRLSSYPHQLSGGMRQRVVIAIAMALKPPFLIMDEPTTALDVVVQREILQQIAELKERLGFSILFITHDLSLIAEFSTRIAILYAGKLAETARAKDLFSDPKHPYTQGLLGSFPSVRGPRRRLQGIPGSPPDMRNPPPGCRFHPRCPQAFATCQNELPLLREIAPEHRGACHLY